MKISKRIHKAISFLLSFVLLFQSFAPALVYAQEVVSEATPTPQILKEAASTDTPSGDLAVAVVQDSPTESLIDTESPPSQPSAALSTDKADYAPTDTAVISGSSLQPNTIYKLVISSSDDPAVRFETEVTTNDQGSFYYSYQLDGNYRPNYLVELFLGSVFITSTTFTDSNHNPNGNGNGNPDNNEAGGGGGNPSANLDQCGNGSAISPDDPCVWKNGNLHTGNSHYVEGQSVPYRVVMEDLPIGTPITLTLGYDIKHSNKHALDYLTHHDRLDPHNSFGHAAEEVDPTDDVTGFSETTTTFPIPTPDTTNSPVTSEPATNFGSLTAVEKVMTLFGGTITNITYNTHGNLTASQSDTLVDVTFTVDSQTAILSWGGHIASRLYWGANNSAGGISGSPYHMRLENWNLGNLGNQDRSLSADAVIPPGNLTIIKDVVPDDNSVWDFTLAGNNLNNTSAQDIPDGGSYAYSLSAGTYTVTEATDPNYTPTVVCNTGETGTNSVTVGLASDENVICTFTNSRNFANLTLVKQVINNNLGNASPAAWTLTASSSSTTISGINGDSTITNAPVSPGTYTLSESGGPTGYTASDWSCVKNGGQAVTGNTIDLATNDSAICTITNDDQPGTLIVKKVVVNDNGGTATSSAFQFQINGGQAVNFENDGQNDLTVNAGTYDITEPSVTGYTITYDNCSQVVVPNGGSATCTITNNDQPGTLIVKKVVKNDNGGTLELQNFSFSVNGGSATNFEVDGQNDLSVSAGTYSVVETNANGYSTTYDNCSNLVIPNGSLATCTITNDDISPQLTIVKNVLNPDGNEVNDSHTFAANVGTVSAQISEGSNAVLGINAGIYTVTESADSDYTNLGCKLPSGANATNFTLNPGQELTVTCTNQQKKATITVYKNVLAYDGTDTADNNVFSVTLNNQSEDFAENASAVYTVNPGNYSAVEDPETNYTFVSSSGPVTVASNGSANIFIVNKQNAGLISGYKYDATGSAILGWIIYLSGDKTDSTATNLDGFYQFLGLNTGSYTVTEDQPLDWTAVGQTSYDITINPGTESSGNDFVNFHNISISGQKFEDKDGNSQKDDGEPGLNDWTIQLLDSDNNLITSTFTDTNGNYLFTNLGPGTYRVREVQKSGWTQTTTNPLDINAASGEDVEGVNFGNFKLVTISGKKFNDLNGDHLYGNTTTDPNLSGWEIQLKDQNGNFISSETTNSSGNYSFSDLGPGTYIVSEVQQTGWDQTRPNGDYGGQGAQTDGTYLLTVSSGDNINGRYFGNFQLGKVSGYKWDDTNGDGVWDQDEPPLEFWTIYLGNDSVETHEDGYYEFSELSMGSYELSESEEDGWTQTKAPDSAVNITSGSDLIDQNFGNFQNASIIVRKNVLGADGQFDVQDGTEFSVILNDGEDQQTISENASASFDNLGPGTYYIAEDSPPDGYELVSINNDVITVESGQTYYVDITNKQVYGTLTVIKEVINDDGGTKEASDFTLNVEGTNVQTPSFSGSEIGTEVFLDAGEYLVSEDETPSYTTTMSEECSGTIAFGENRTCTVTNDDQPGTLIVKKEIVGSEEPASNFSFTINDSDPQQFESDGQNELNVDAGSYNITETSVAGFVTTYENCQEINVTNGGSATCTITNTAANPKLNLAKSNNATSDKHPGENVTFTLTLTVSGSGISDPKVIDLPAKGFKYRAGSYQVLINGFDVTTTLPEPTYASPGTWTLPDLQAGDEVIMTYIADIDTAETPGSYQDLAWAKGTSLIGSSLLAEGSDGNFVGTEVNVVKSNQDTPSVNVNKEEKQEGQVLGATTLPATGANTRWLYLALILGLLGTASTTAGIILSSLSSRAQSRDPSNKK